VTDGLAEFQERQAIAAALEEIGSLLELKGENRFRVRAFRTAARALAGFGGSLRSGLEDGSLARTRGIGPVTLAIIAELLQTGRASLLDDLREEIPAGLVRLIEGAGLSVTRAQLIHERLGIETVEELEAAALDGRLAALPRFGAKTAAGIVKAIADRREASRYRLLHRALAEAETLRSALRQLPGVLRVEAAGEVRRSMEVVSELVMVIVTEDARALERGLGPVAGARLVVATPATAGAALLTATGSDDHLRGLGERAAARGLALADGALTRGGTALPAPDETAVYAALDLPVIPPELREGRGEIELAARGTLPILVERGDLRGCLHCHTRASDGTNTNEQLAVASRKAGYQWLGITDHSQAAAYAGGLRPEQLLRQLEEIDRLNDELAGIRILKGIEADILQDGAIDYDDHLLARLDFVIGSVHSRFGMAADARAMTARILAAMDSPFLTILGHPTGRLLLSRDPYEVDLDAVIARAAERGVAIEINGDPHRLDLDWRHLARARAAGVAISIGADAHSLAGIGNMEFGLAMARKGGLAAGDVLNTLSADEFLAFARRRR
jgi:DNA polymerase (family 10)